MGGRFSGKSSARKDYQRRKKEVLTSSDFILCGAAVILILKWKEQVVRQASIDVLGQASLADAPLHFTGPKKFDELLICNSRHVLRLSLTYARPPQPLHHVQQCRPL